MGIDNLYEEDEEEEHEPDVEIDDSTVEDSGFGITKVNLDNVEELLDGQFCLVYIKQLLILAKLQKGFLED